MCIEKTYIDKTLSVKQIMEKHNVPQATASAIKKRGYIVKRTKPTKVNKKRFNLALATRAAEYIFFKKMRHRLQTGPGVNDGLKDDLIQEGLLRALEMSGLRREGNEFNYYCKVSVYAMYNYLKKNHIIGTWQGREISFDENILGHGIYG